MLIGGKYVLGKQIGTGAFGEIFEGVCKADGTKVAIKLEKTSAPCPRLAREAKAYRQVQGHEQGIPTSGMPVGIPQVFWFGPAGDYSAMVMELLGPNLDVLLTRSGGRFTVGTVAVLGISMLSLIESLHSCDFVHRDIKPENFVVGLGSASTAVHMIDLGLAKRYRSAKTREHMAYSDQRCLIGTARYASLNTHMGIEPSRRDDIESLGYVLVYLLTGRLPWEGIKASSQEERLEQIMERKMSISIEELCQGLPSKKHLIICEEEVATLLYYARSLGFEEKPDYDYLADVLNRCLLSNPVERLDWENDPQKKKQKSRKPSEEEDADIPTERTKQEAMLKCVKVLSAAQLGQNVESGSNDGSTDTAKLSPFAYQVGIKGLKMSLRHNTCKALPTVQPHS